MADTVDWTREQLAEILELSLSEIRDDSHLRDELDTDSVDLVEVANRVERTFGITIEDDALYDVNTVAEFAAVIDALRP